jgi:hypothetical protein
MPFDSTELVRPRSQATAWARLGRVLAVFLARGPAAAPAEPLGPAVLRVLEEARGLIEEREDWTQGSYTTFAGRRCAIGALGAAGAVLDYKDAMAIGRTLLSEVARARGYRDVEEMNDRSSHARVLSAFDAAVGEARRRFLLPSA